MSKNIGLTSCLYCSERACQVAYDAIEEITRLRSDLATLRAENYNTQSLLAGAEAECDALRARNKELVAMICEVHTTLMPNYSKSHEGRVWLEKMAKLT